MVMMSYLVIVTYYYKMRLRIATLLLQNPAKVYNKMRQVFIIICDSFITTCDNFCKIRHLLQNAKCIGTPVV